ncbi:uncharacterized protein P174DRAFT_476910 [Aspergillus novofumigatus IBT 16806]|uniref:Uncharacterized protein n=1 Tax=Aspergillus novofumigatus (strain IBT 16806) TaxID=1392255 RepID=A0A2I1CHR1_ASPN1|nr:uncharacterized protein P174DRAFT_476910 [Aspergillus novofumigatus IBT 16806]PKX97168.1 hypothetical protein P174DRAFT_476910 [Aspergillus novofumigatus IBT 16806]
MHPCESPGKTKGNRDTKHCRENAIDDDDDDDDDDDAEDERAETMQTKHMTYRDSFARLGNADRLTDPRRCFERIQSAIP